MRRFGAIVALALLSGPLAGCAAFRHVIAEDQDVADYRSYRVAAHPGRRLGFASAYLEEHPHGAFADEVRTAFDADEAAFFERAKTSRSAAREYLTYLPRGPHAAQAVALITAFDTNLEEKELAEVARKVRRDEALLEAAAVARRRVAETVLAAVGALTVTELYGARIEDTPDAVRRVLATPVPRTWGGPLLSRATDLYFLLPTRPERESRVASVEVELSLDPDGQVVEAEISGEDLFVRWQEADRIVALDPTRAEDRAQAQAHAKEVLGGALEGRFPRETCSTPPAPGALFARACDGLAVQIVPGESAGAVDRIVFTAQKKR
jgi:hypothetical protein